MPAIRDLERLGLVTMERIPRKNITAQIGVKHSGGYQRANLVSGLIGGVELHESIRPELARIQFRRNCLRDGFVFDGNEAANVLGIAADDSIVDIENIYWLHMVALNNSMGRKGLHPSEGTVCLPEHRVYVPAPALNLSARPVQRPRESVRLMAVCSAEREPTMTRSRRARVIAV
jgi:hypothetical protein